MVPDVDLFVIKKHAIHSLDSSIGGLGCLIMNETVSFGAPDFVGGDLAR
jgi:hypothetical protein